MRVPLEPSANLAANPNPRATSAPSSADVGVPTKHKPLLQARRNQYEDYRNLKDRDFQSLHEEVSHLRQCTRDQERIIGILKEEKNRLLAELLQKGKDLQHLKDVMKRPSQTQEERNQLDELKRTLADRECTVDELKSEIVRLNNLHQRALEEYDDVLAQLKDMEQQVFNAEQEAQHRAADAERLKKDIELLNEEMATRLNCINQAVNHAAEVGKRDASTDHHLLEEQVEAWKVKCEEAHAQLKRAQDEEQRHKEHALRQQAAANEVAAEKAHLLSEVRRQQTLLAEMDDLKAQIEAFRIDKATTEEVLREKLHVALVDIHEEKELSRKLMAEVDSKEDAIAAKERDMAKLQREFDARLDEACAQNKLQHKEAEAELIRALEAAQKEKTFHSEEAARVAAKLDVLQRHCLGLEAQVTALTDSQEAQRRSSNAQSQRISELEAALIQAQAALEESLAELQRLQPASPKLSKSLKKVEEDLAMERQKWDLERQSIDMRHQREIATLQASHETALHQLAEAATQEQQALVVEVTALREAQTEHDHIRHEALAREVDRLTDALEQATNLLAQERSENETLDKQLEELSQAAELMATQQEELQSRAVSLEEKVQSQEKDIEELKTALVASEERIEELVATAAVAEEAKQQLLAAGDSAAAVDKKLERLEKDKRSFQEKIRVLEVARDDLQKSLEIRSSQLRQEAEQNKLIRDELQAVRASLAEALQKMEQEAAAHARAIREMEARQEEVRAAHKVELSSLQDIVASLTEENTKMKNIQMHW